MRFVQALPCLPRVARDLHHEEAGEDLLGGGDKVSVSRSERHMFPKCYKLVAEAPHLSHSGVQQLLLQAFLCHKEVEEGHLDRDLRRVVGVAQLGGHVESEVWVVGDGVVANLDDLAAALQAGEQL